jgi:hypothetical protein
VSEGFLPVSATNSVGQTSARSPSIVAQRTLTSEVRTCSDIEKKCKCVQHSGHTFLLLPRLPICISTLKLRKVPTARN